MFKKIIVSMLIYIIVISQCFSAFSLSGMFDWLGDEVVGELPVEIPETPPDDPTPPSEPYVPPAPAEPEEPKITITVPTKLEGYVFEDYERQEIVNDSSALGTAYITNNYRKDNDEPTVSGVQIINGSDEVIAVTGSNGKYTISESGKYNLRFKSGDNTSSVNTYKYNGQDYSMAMAGEGTYGLELSYIRRIQEMEDSYTEVYIVIDYSATMRKIENGKTRGQIVREAAKKFIHELFEEAEDNLAVGFIAFGFEAVIVKRPTPIESDVINAINGFEVQDGVCTYNGQTVITYTSLNHNVGTNIAAAANKVIGNFLSDKSNKVMVLFSDGAATAHESVESIKISDSDAVIDSKLRQVADITRAELQAVINSNIKLINVLNKTEGVENEYVKLTFGNGADISNMGQTIIVDYFDGDTLAKELIEKVLPNVEEGDRELIHYKEKKEFSGNDDPDRRNEINSYFSNFNYDKLKVFEASDGVASSSITTEDVNEFIANTWIQTTNSGVIKIYEINSSGDTTTIESDGEVLHTLVYYEGTDEETGELVSLCDVDGNTYKAENVNIVETTTVLNGMFIRRDEFKLELEQKITGIRLTLSDGTVLYDKVSNNAKLTNNKNKLFKEIYANQLKGNTNGLVVQSLEIDEVKEYIPNSVTLISDRDLMQGATLEVEYTFVIKNNSKNGTFSKSFSIVDYFGTDMVYRADGNLISEEGKNSDYGWKIVTCQELYEEDLGTGKLQWISDKTVEGNEDMQCLFASYTKQGYEIAEEIPADGNITDFETKSKYINPVIGNNGERYAKVVLSRVVSAEVLDNFTYKNQAEILQYSNNNSRRINWLEEIGGVVTGKVAVSGNYMPVSFPNSYTLGEINADEVDTSLANPVKIIPPTGKEINYMDIAIIAIISINVLAIIGIKNKKRKNNRI